MTIPPSLIRANVISAVQVLSRICTNQCAAIERGLKPATTRLTRLDSAVGIGVDYSGSLAIDGIDTGDHDQLKYLGTVCHRIA